MNGGRATGRNSAGFTIIEVMIVLAVTGALFVSVALTMAGKQRKAEFTQATNDIQAVVQQTINEVSSGFYPTSENFVCTQVAGPAISITSGVRSQGQNEQCVFLGKVMFFGQNPTSAVPQVFNTFSIAGLRSGKTLSTSAPTVIQNGTIDTTITSSLKYGLQVKSIKYNNVAGDLAANDVAVGAVAFTNDQGTVDTGGNYMSGTSKVNLIPVRSTALNQTRASQITAVNTYLKDPANVVNPLNGVKICLAGGGQTAVLTIGSNGHDLQVKTEVKTCS